jgi:hypothetical protein
MRVCLNSFHVQYTAYCIFKLQLKKGQNSPWKSRKKFKKFLFFFSRMFSLGELLVSSRSLKNFMNVSILLKRFFMKKRNFSSWFEFLWMRSSRVIRTSGCQCQSRNSPGLDTSNLRHNGIWAAEDEAVLNNLHKNKNKNFWPLDVQM